MQDQAASTRQYFDKISKQYAKKYGTQNKFTRYFFNQRLEEAVKGQEFNGKSILDIGAGTGNLYDCITAISSNVKFLGTDISEEMLKASPIPESNYKVGSVYELDLPDNNFDIVYSLGVTTYMNEVEIKRNFECIENVLKPGGSAIISFTNKASIDTSMRMTFKPLINKIKKGDGVINQSFKIYTYTPHQAKALFSGFDVLEVRYLNHTVFPFNLLIPGLAISIASVLRAILPSFLLKYFSSDFLIVATRKNA